MDSLIQCSVNASSAMCREIAMLRRASRSLLPLALRAVGNPRGFHGAVSAAVSPKNDTFALHLNRASSLRFSALVKPRSHHQRAQEPHTEESMREGFPFEIQDSGYENGIKMVRELDGETITLEIDIPPYEVIDTPFIILAYSMIVTISKDSRTTLEFGITIVPNNFAIRYSSLRDPDRHLSVWCSIWPRFTGNWDGLGNKWDKRVIAGEGEKYLEERGITLDFTNYLHQLHHQSY